MARVLYISYDGMTDPLGRSQILPYLAGLSAKAHQITILSAEKAEAFRKGEQHIRSICKTAGLRWVPVPYTKKPPIVSTQKDIRRLWKEAAALHAHKAFDFTHCRSYIAALVGWKMKRRYSVPFLFDMRGFFPDERVEGGLWNLKNPLFKQVYKHFKKREKDFLQNADVIVSLTEHGKNEMMQWNLKLKPEKIHVIPCCADLDHFHYHNAKANHTEAFRKALGLPDNAFVLTYLGSVGTWYMMDEMFSFFKALKKKKATARFLFITKDDPEMIRKLALEQEVDPSDLHIKSAEREELPSLLALAQLSIFFIKPVFSKRASSPTKLAELLGMGIPVICNSGVGDLDLHLARFSGAYVVHAFHKESYQKAIEQIPALLQSDPDDLRALAEKYYALQHGLDRYHVAYQAMQITANRES